MYTKSFRDELLTTQAELIARLQTNPDYKHLQLVNQMLEVCGEKSTARLDLEIPDERTTQKNTREELAAMNMDAKRYQAQHHNAPISVKDLTAIVEGKGHIIKGKFPGTTFGAVLSGRKKEWKLHSPGMWVLTEEEYAALRNRAQNEKAGMRPAA